MEEIQKAIKKWEIGSFNMPEEWKERWLLFTFIITKDKRIPETRFDKPEFKRSLVVRDLIDTYINNNEALFVQQEFNVWKEGYLKQRAKRKKQRERRK